MNLAQTLPIQFAPTATALPAILRWREATSDGPLRHELFIRDDFDPGGYPSLNAMRGTASGVTFASMRGAQVAASHDARAAVDALRTSWGALTRADLPTSQDDTFTILDGELRIDTGERHATVALASTNPRVAAFVDALRGVVAVVR